MLTLAVPILGRDQGQEHPALSSEHEAGQAEVGHGDEESLGASLCPRGPLRKKVLTDTGERLLESGQHAVGPRRLILAPGETRGRWPVMGKGVWAEPCLPPPHAPPTSLRQVERAGPVWAATRFGRAGHTSRVGTRGQRCPSVSSFP